MSTGLQRAESGRAGDPYVRDDPTTPRVERRAAKRKTADRPARKAEAWPRRSTEVLAVDPRALRLPPAFPANLPPAFPANLPPALPARGAGARMAAPPLSMPPLGKARRTPLPPQTMLAPPTPPQQPAAQPVPPNAPPLATKAAPAAAKPTPVAAKAAPPAMVHAPPPLPPPPHAAPPVAPPPHQPPRIANVESIAARPQAKRAAPKGGSMWKIVLVAVLGGLAWWKVEQSSDLMAVARSVVSPATSAMTTTNAGTPGPAMSAGPAAASAAPSAMAVSAPNGMSAPSAMAAPPNAMSAPSAMPVPSAMPSGAAPAMPVSAVANATPESAGVVEGDNPLLGTIRRMPPDARMPAAPPIPAATGESGIPGVPPQRPGKITPDPSRLGGVRVTLPFKVPAARPPSGASPAPSAAATPSARSHSVAAITSAASGRRAAAAAPAVAEPRPAASIEEQNANERLQALMRQ